MVKRCPRCHSSMLIDHDESIGSRQMIWKCLGCGRAIDSDPAEQARDDQLLAGIRMHLEQDRSRLRR